MWYIHKPKLIIYILSNFYKNNQLHQMCTVMKLRDIDDHLTANTDPHILLLYI